MTISFYKGLNRNLEVGNTLVCALHNIWRLESVKYTKFGTNISNKMLLNAAKCQHYSFYQLWAEIWKSEIPSSAFCTISGDWSQLSIPNLARISLIKCYSMLQNARVTAFTSFDQKSWNQKYPRLSFAQYMETGVS